eukprot:Phypoly_transcript_12093.p1 GENE.Phypoly_transcript_12093~~Phypoly_transcript_12093.p1  ORF type:complete len:380 (+),score=100.63 Phypoly_transcript_12093:3-1142(+)
MNYGHLHNKTDTSYAAVAASQYNIITPENEMKWGATHPARNTYTFSQGDYIVQYAQNNSMSVRGHNLCWGNSLPSWLTGGNFSASDLKEILQDHINTTMNHFKGKLYAWDVVNEALSDNIKNASDSTQWFKPNLWFNAIPNYVDLAFQYARAADPNTKLFYNEYSVESVSQTKATAMYNMVKSMKDRGIPIDGVGLQMHVSNEIYPSYTQLSQNIKRFWDLGIEVHITEMDVNLKKNVTADRLQMQAKVYSTVMQACFNTSGCKSFETWGYTDEYTFAGSDSAPLPFDVNYNAKPAQNALVAVAQQFASLPTPSPAPTPSPTSPPTPTPSPSNSTTPPTPSPTPSPSSTTSPDISPSSAPRNVFSVGLAFLFIFVVSCL